MSAQGDVLRREASRRFPAWMVDVIVETFEHDMAEILGRMEAAEKANQAISERWSRAMRNGRIGGTETAPDTGGASGIGHSPRLLGSTPGAPTE